VEEEKEGRSGKWWEKEGGVREREGSLIRYH
jgi:hypothetical protein